MHLCSHWGETSSPRGLVLLACEQNLHGNLWGKTWPSAFCPGGNNVFPLPIISCLWILVTPHFKEEEGHQLKAEEDVIYLTYVNNYKVKDVFTLKREDDIWLMDASVACANVKTSF